jgi:hypothetical protein
MVPGSATSAGAAAAPTEDDTVRYQMPTVTVTANKRHAARGGPMS